MLVVVGRLKCEVFYGLSIVQFQARSKNETSSQPTHQLKPMRTQPQHDKLTARLNSSWRRTLAAAATVLTMTVAVHGAQIGMNFVRGAGADGPNVQNGFANALLPDALAGVAPYTQTNWNNLGNRGTNITLIDAGGASSGVVANWVAGNCWSIAGGTPGALGVPDTDLMNCYLDSNNGGNTALTTNLFLNPTANMPLVYLSGLAGWMSAQGVSYFDLVIYMDGDNQAGRCGEYWLQIASGTADNLTFDVDLTTHVFVRDYNNFLLNPTYQQVPLTSNNGRVANSGNYVVFTGLSADSVLVRTAEFNTRAVINAIQIIPRVSAPGATLEALPASETYAGGTASFRIKAAGVRPMSFQWQKNGAPLSDGGNISGATTATLNIANVGGADAGNYSVVVSNASGVVTSSVAPLAVVAPAAGSYAEKIVTSSPVAYWRLNETGDPSTNNSPAYDSVGGFNAIYGPLAQNGYNGIVGPRPPAFPSFESANTALQTVRNTATPIPYPSTYVSWAVAPPLGLNTNTVTVCAWIYPTANQTANTAILSARGADVNTFGFYNGGYNYLGYTWNNAAATYNFSSGLSPASNQWSFVAWVITPTNAIIYLYSASGQFSATNNVAHTNVAFAGVTMIGDDPSSTTIPQDRAFVGSLDEVAVFNRSLSPTEIADLYKKGLNITLIPPVIAAQPVSSAIFEGRNTRFNVTASGEEPLTYQWRKNTINVSDGGTLSGTTSRTLVITGAVAGDAGSYDVVITSPGGSVTSTAATLMVVPTNAPAAYEARLRAANPIAYWRLNEASSSLESYDLWGGNNLANTSVTLGVPGPVPPEYSGIESTNTGGQFDGFSSSSSASASLMNNLAQFSVIGWFNIPAQILTTRIGLFGQNDVIEFGFHGNGTDLIPQVGVYTPRGSAFLNQSTNVFPNTWYLIAAVGSGTNVNLYLASTNGAGGVTVVQSSTTHAASVDYGAAPFPFRIGGGGILDVTGNFFPGVIDEVAVFNRAISPSEFSDLFGAALSGGDLPPAISADPVSQTLYAGRTATFTVSAVGTSPQYRWRKDNVPLTDGGGISGATTPTLTIANVSAVNQGIYEVLITNRVGSITSAPASLTVITPVPDSYESAVIALNPIAYYRLNETDDPSGGTAVVSDFWGGLNGTYGVASQNGFIGIAGPRPTDGFGIFEAANNALMTSTDGSWATTAPWGITANALTITAWVYPLSYVDRAGFVFVRAGQPATGINFIGTGNLNYHWLDNAATYNWDSGLNVPLNQWSFVALVIEPTQGTMYLKNANGSQSAVNVVANAVRTFSDTVRIGGDPNSAARTFNGSIDEVAIFPYALSASQIQDLYSGTVTPVVSLTVQQIGGNVVLTWPQGTLLEANEVTGPYTTNNASSPYTNAPTAPRKFYQVIVK